jgi:formate dehydrogenase
MSHNTSAPVTAKFSPGFGKKRKKYEPKGRQVQPHALQEVSVLLGDVDLNRRDLLIEHLHVIQDKFGHLSAAHLAALAELMKISQTEVYEVATFYAHFDVVKENQTPPASKTIRVCESLTCMLSGAEKLISELEASASANVRVVRAPCMGRCQSAPVAEVQHNPVDHATTTKVNDAIQQELFETIVPEYQNFVAYQASGGYDLLESCLANQKKPEQLIDILTDAKLRGLGGAGFPTGRKWQFVRSYQGPRVMAVNADEGEPGTFKDRHYLESNPHNFLQGMLIAAWAVEAKTVFIYLRDEYPAARKILQTEIAALEAAGLSRHTTIELRRGAGAYICGEESALIESVEGKKGLPRHRPPYVAEVGIYNLPTLVQNVETLYWIPEIINHGAEWFTKEGRNGGVGLRSYSVSGRVNNPGVKLAPAGITVKELIEEYCGGMVDGHDFKAYLPGGASGGILPANMGDLPLEFGQLEAHGCFVGSHAVVILSNADDMKEVALNLMKFFEDESCGQCTPCRVGTEKAVALMQEPTWNLSLLDSLSSTMRDASICGLGQAASNPLSCVIKYFPEEINSTGGAQ